MSKPVIGLALGSGAARGWSHIGVIETLEAEGISADVIAGCSMGAFVGAAYLTGRLPQLRDWAQAARWPEITGLIDVSLNGSGLIEGKLIGRLMQDLGIVGRIEDQQKKFACIATDYLTGHEEWLMQGEIADAVRASISLPGIFSPAKIGSEWFVDGGLVNPVPVSTCRALGANFIIAVNLNGSLVGRRQLPQKRPEKDAGWADFLTRSLASVPKTWRDGAIRAASEFLSPKPSRPGYFDVLANSINIMQDRITRSRLAGEPPHVLITPRLANMGIFDFDKASLSIEEGRSCARYALPEIKRQLHDGIADIA